MSRTDSLYSRTQRRVGTKKIKNRSGRNTWAKRKAPRWFTKSVVVQAAEPLPVGQIN